MCVRLGFHVCVMVGVHVCVRVVIHVCVLGLAFMYVCKGGQSCIHSNTHT
jgi:hypothetical protein